MSSSRSRKPWGIAYDWGYRLGWWINAKVLRVHLCPDCHKPVAREYGWEWLEDGGRRSVWRHGRCFDAWLRSQEDGS